MQKIFVNQKGFNLFTALVAVVLILASFVLIQTMISTESNIKSQVYDLRKNFGLSDAANIARADSVQTFNYHFRNELENYLTWNGTDNTGLTILKINKNEESNFDNWDDVIKAFEESILLTNANTGDNNLGAVLNFVSGKLVSEFKESTYGTYSVTLSGKTDSAAAKSAIKQAMSNAIEKQKKANESNPDQETKFLELVDCDDSDCPVGTFYFNIPLSKITDEDYEKLPRINVKDNITGEETKIAILPRSDLKVYIPVRFFKALFEARKAAIVIQDKYLELKEMRTGFCEAGCAPRNDAMQSRTGNWGNACVGGEEDVTITLDGAQKIFKSSPSNGNNLQKFLEASAISNICTASTGDDFSVWDPDFMNIDVQGPQLIRGLEAGKPLPWAVINCPFQIINVNSGNDPAKDYRETCSGIDKSELSCSAIVNVQGYVILQETNTLYTVKGDNKKFRIGISVDFPDAGITKNGVCASESGCSSC